MRRDGSDRTEKQRAASSGKRRGPREYGNSSEIIAQRRAAREAEDAFLAAVQARIDAGRQPASFVHVGDVLPSLLAEARQRLADAEARAASHTDGKLEGELLDEQLDDSRGIDVYADALDQLALVQP